MKEMIRERGEEIINILSISNRERMR